MLKKGANCVDWFRSQQGWGLYSCHGGENQQFSVVGGKLCNAMGKCVEVYGATPRPNPVPAPNPAPPPAPVPRPVVSPRRRSASTHRRRRRVSRRRRRRRNRRSLLLENNNAEVHNAEVFNKLSEVTIGLATSNSVRASDAEVRVNFDTHVDRSAGDEIVLLSEDGPIAKELVPPVVSRARSTTKAGVLTLILNPDVSPDVHFRTPYVPISPGKYRLAYDTLGQHPEQGDPGHDVIEGPELELLPSRPTQPGQAVLTWAGPKGLRVSWKPPLFNGANNGLTAQLEYKVSAKVKSSGSDDIVLQVDSKVNEVEVIFSRKDLQVCPTESGKLGCVFQVRAKNSAVDEWSQAGWWSEMVDLQGL